MVDINYEQILIDKFINSNKFTIKFNQDLSVGIGKYNKIKRFHYLILFNAPYELRITPHAIQLNKFKREVSHEIPRTITDQFIMSFELLKNSDNDKFCNIFNSITATIEDIFGNSLVDIFEDKIHFYE